MSHPDDPRSADLWKVAKIKEVSAERSFRDLMEEMAGGTLHDEEPSEVRDWDPSIFPSSTACHRTDVFRGEGGVVGRAADRSVRRTRAPRLRDQDQRRGMPQHHREVLWEDMVVLVR